MLYLKSFSLHLQISAHADWGPHKILGPHCWDFGNSLVSCGHFCLLCLYFGCLWFYGDLIVTYLNCTRQLWILIQDPQHLT